MYFEIDCNIWKRKHLFKNTEENENKKFFDVSGLSTELNCFNTERITILTHLEHKNYHHQMPALTAACFDLDCGQPQRHHAGAPSQRYQAPGNNNVTPPQLPISLNASRHFLSTGHSWNRLGIA